MAFFANLFSENMESAKFNKNGPKEKVCKTKNVPKYLFQQICTAQFLKNLQSTPFAP